MMTKIRNKLLRFFNKRKIFNIKKHDIFTRNVSTVECTLEEKVQDLYKNLIYYPIWMRWIYWPYLNHITGFSKRCSTVKAYLPLLWDDIDNNSSDILKLLEKKLERMIPVFKEGHSLHCNDRAKELERALFLVKRLLKSEYLHHASEEIERRLGKTKRRATRLEGGGVMIEFWNGEEEVEKANENRHRRIRRAIHRKWDNKKRADTQYLFNFMGKKLHTWLN